MIDAQKPDHISLNTLVNRLKEGRYMIPNFQRQFEWEPWDITSLMRSIFLDYYIGSLLLWRGTEENYNALSCEHIEGYQNGGNPEYIVLDGQQRLTAIYYAFFAPDKPLPRRSTRCFYFINIDKFCEEEYEEAFDYAWSSQRTNLRLDKLELQYKEHIFPLSIIGRGGWELSNWVQGYEGFWQDKVLKAQNMGSQADLDIATRNVTNGKFFSEHLKGITEQYQISYIELDRALAVDKVCDIFTQINSRGMRLDVFDLMNALLTPKGLELKKMWTNSAPRLEFIDTNKMNIYILQVMSILTQAYCSPKYLYYLLPNQPKPVRDPDGTRRKETLITNGNEFDLLWNQAVDSLEQAIKLLKHPQEFGAIKSKYVPYDSILPVFAALQAYVKGIDSGKQLNAQRKIRHWYWASIFTKRYSGSVASTSARDFLDIKEWIENDDAEPAVIMEFKNSFKNIDLKGEVRSNTSVYNGIFNLLVLQGARDWITGAAPQHDDLDDHHIVPQWWGKENLDGNLIHTILNRTPLIGSTNRGVIGDTLPTIYLPKLIFENGEAEVRAILESHLISPKAQEILMKNPFTPEDFNAFINERQMTFKEAIENLLIKERIDLPPQIRELDQEIENIELDLRILINKVLEGNILSIPQHISQNVEERIQREAQKNPAFDNSYNEILEKKLEYFDLRELQNLITNKALWDQFRTTFSNKEALNLKFGQLADLRNVIRHSRTVDSVTRKEGEAAILWFKQVI